MYFEIQFYQISNKFNDTKTYKTKYLLISKYTNHNNKSLTQ